MLIAGIHALSITTGHFKEIVFCFRNKDIIDGIHAKANVKIKSREIQCYAEQDSDWSVYFFNNGTFDYQQTVDRYRAEINQLLNELDSVTIANSDNDRLNKVQQVINHFKEKRNKRSQQPFAPSQLPGANRTSGSICTETYGFSKQKTIFV